MNQYLLHVSAQASHPGLPAWQANLFKLGVVVMPMRTLPEALQYAKVYKAIMVIMDIEAPEAAAQEVRAAREATEGPLPPIVGLMASRPCPEAMAQLAEAGVADLVTADDPEAFILWRLELLRRLGELARFEQSRMDVAELARKTRTILHDLSQPLSAVQGRLQLMAAKCPASDPNAQVYNELVRLAFDVTHQLMQIQQLHRQFS